MDALGHGCQHTKTNNVTEQTWIVGPAEGLSSSQGLPQILRELCDFIAVGKAGQVDEACNTRVKGARMSYRKSMTMAGRTAFQF